MIIYDDDGMGHDVVPMSVIGAIKKDIANKRKQYMADNDYNDGVRLGLMLAYQMVDKHISGKAESEDDLK